MAFVLCTSRNNSQDAIQFDIDVKLPPPTIPIYVPLNLDHKSPTGNTAASNKHFSTPMVLLAGFIAGVISRTITAPFDRLSICMRAGYTIHASNQGSMFGTLQSMVRNAGLKSLWRGTGVNCIQVQATEDSVLLFLSFRCFRSLSFSFLHILNT
jgi:hypothetical protein